MSDILTQLADYGSLGLVLAVVIWLYVAAIKRQDQQNKDNQAAAINRENALAERIRELETDYREVFLPAMERSTQAITDNTQALRELRDFLRVDTDSRANRVHNGERT